MKRMVFLFAVIVVSYTVAGCATGMRASFEPSSHFSFPNSNVETLGPVKVKEGGHVSIMTPALMTSEDKEKLYQAALAQVEDANLIIDYVIVEKQYLIPIPPGVYFNVLELEGVAAHAELGEQNIDAGATDEGDSGDSHEVKEPGSQEARESKDGGT